MQAEPSTSSTSNIQPIIDALVDYANITGVNLSENPFAAAIEGAKSPGDILILLKERENAFNVYREQNRRLINCLTPAVNVIHAFSGILGETAGFVSPTWKLLSAPSHVTLLGLLPALTSKALFVGIDVLLSVRSFTL